MSELSYLEKLMDGVEVEWKAVGDIAGYSTTKVDADKLDATSFVGVDNLLADKGGRIDATYQPNTARLTAYEPGDILLGNIRPYLKKVWMAENNGGCSGDVLAIRILADCKKIISPEYLYYALSSDSFFSYSMQHAKGAKMPRGSKDAILNYQIPIPCPSAPEKSLAIQSEIVRILDKFTALTAELTAELNMRKKQYNYYRDQLLRFKEGEVEWKTLGEIGDFTYGYAAKAMDSGDARFVRITDINKDGKLSKENPMYVELNEENEKYTLDKNDLLMARTGATFGKTMIFEEDYPAVYAGFLIKLNLNKTIINAKYYWHFAQSDFFWEQANKLVSGGGQPQFNANALKQVRVPIPYPSHPQKSLDEQGRIVDILDKFDAIAASITEGLPREIELRQKQYEYYRDLLLSFPKPETVSK
ncbi:restriction endonuclease subunit S [Escherichia coli]|uniref:restriction endonuclease subunit S n=1 Tax=Escherichia coli TaxID=562 RepID=UPI0017CED953|nr:restriction endonuclease subunit S [Escherichia coli]EFE6881855.1 restriction endonuclease subunit S [Escherichia coli]MDW9262902.1 restriction endonuclease subunit S [Escherichia coli]MDW9295971.1 restriction endonuclease subunit S [Escherichia coli]HAY3986718.1 restriction endonuclease subunit S [Escherichia coli]